MPDYHGGEQEKSRPWAIVRLLIFTLILISVLLVIIAQIAKNKNIAFLTGWAGVTGENIVITIIFSGVAMFLALLLMGKEIWDFTKSTLRTMVAPTRDAFRYMPSNVGFAVTGKLNKIPPRKDDWMKAEKF